jgi:hypothetical protein
MKLRNITLAALAALAALAGQAFAAPVVTPVSAAEAATAADTLYFSGSSAAKAIISGLVSQNCNTGSFVTFSDSTGNYNAYACRVAATNDWGLAENTIVVVNKRDDQGSGYGVFPVATNTAVNFLDLASTPVSGKYLLAAHTADVGISDVEPTLFNNTASRPAAFKTSAAVTNASFANVTITQPDGSSSTQSVTPVFSQVFGVAVTQKLYNALQAAKQTIDGTTTGVPTVSRDFLANLFSQNVSSVGWAPLNVANAAAGVNICFRDQGSGTRVAGNLFFGQFPGNGTSGFSPLDGTASTVSAVSDTAGDVYVAEPGSGGGVVTCLQSANALSTGYGIGLLGFGTAEATGFKYVAVDGVYPSRDAAKTGKYGFWVESTIQVNKLSNATAAAKAWMNKFIAKAQQPTNLAQLTAAAQNGVFALPLAQAETALVSTDDCATYAGTYSSSVAGATNADKFCGRFVREGTGGADNRLVPVFLK